IVQAEPFAPLHVRAATPNRHLRVVATGEGEAAAQSAAAEESVFADDAAAAAGEVVTTDVLAVAGEAVLVDVPTAAVEPVTAAAVQADDLADDADPDDADPGALLEPPDEAPHS